MATKQICPWYTILQCLLYNLPRWDDPASGKTLSWLAPDFTACQYDPNKNSSLRHPEATCLKRWSTIQVLLPEPNDSSSIWKLFKHLKMVIMTPGPSWVNICSVFRYFEWILYSFPVPSWLHCSEHCLGTKHNQLLHNDVGVALDFHFIYLEMYSSINTPQDHISLFRSHRIYYWLILTLQLVKTSSVFSNMH